MKSDIKMRFAFIETRLYWGEGLTASQLAAAFGLSRPHAQTVIDDYCRQYPGAMRFDAKRRRQIAGPQFEPRYIRISPNRFLDHVRGQALSAYYVASADWSDMPFEDVEQLLMPRLSRGPLQAVFQGLYEQKTVVLDYQAKVGMSLRREISPHHLIFASNRYHLRGYCHITGKYPDFDLSRILSSELSITPWVSNRDDSEWNELKTLYFKLNQKLPLESQAALRRDYDLDEDDTLSINCRQALAFYVRRHLLVVDGDLGLARWIEYR